MSSTGKQKLSKLLMDTEDVPQTPIIKFCEKFNLFYRTISNVNPEKQDKNNMTLEQWSALSKGGTVKHDTNPNILYKKHSGNDIVIVNLSYNKSNIVALDIDDETKSYEEIREIIKEKFGMYLPHTRSRNKRLPHYYFILNGLPFHTGNQKKMVDLPADLASSYSTNKDGDQWSINMWEDINTPIYDFDDTLPEIDWEDVKDHFKLDLERPAKVKTPKTINVKLDSTKDENTGFTIPDQLFTQEEIQFMDSFIETHGLTNRLQIYKDKREDAKTIHRVFEYSNKESYECPFCKNKEGKPVKHKGNNNHPFFIKKGRRLTFVCRPSTKAILVAELESTMDVDIYTTDWFKNNNEWFNRNHILTENGKWYRLYVKSKTNVEVEEMSDKGVDNICYNKIYAQPKEDGKIKEIKFLETWKKSPERPLYKEIKWVCDRNYKEEGVINTFCGFRSEEIDIDPSFDTLFQEWYDTYYTRYFRCLTNGNKHIEEYLHLLITHRFTRTLETTEVIPIFCHKTEGTGKSTFAKLIAIIGGDSKKYLITSDGVKVITGAFAPPQLQYALVVSLEELGSLSKDEWNKLKTVSQDDEFIYNFKNQRQFSAPRVWFMTGSTNDPEDINVSQTNRRLLPIKTSDELAGQSMKPYWNGFFGSKDIFGLCHPQCYARLFHMYVKRPLVWSMEEYNGDVRGQPFNVKYLPQTDLAVSLTEQSLPDINKFLIENWDTLKPYINGSVSEVQSSGKKTKKHIEKQYLNSLFRQFKKDTGDRRTYTDDDIRKKIMVSWDTFCTESKASVATWKFTDEQQTVVDAYVAKYSIQDENEEETTNTCQITDTDSVSIDSPNTPELNLVLTNKEQKDVLKSIGLPIESSEDSETFNEKPPSLPQRITLSKNGKIVFKNSKIKTIGEEDHEPVKIDRQTKRKHMRQYQQASSSSSSLEEPNETNEST